VTTTKSIANIIAVPDQVPERLNVSGGDMGTNFPNLVSTCVAQKMPGRYDVVSTTRRLNRKSINLINDAHRSPWKANTASSISVVIASRRNDAAIFESLVINCIAANMA
jgi:hypothetical protein